MRRTTKIGFLSLLILLIAVPSTAFANSSSATAAAETDIYGDPILKFGQTDSGKATTSPLGPNRSSYFAGIVRPENILNSDFSRPTSVKNLDFSKYYCTMGYGFEGEVPRCVAWDLYCSQNVGYNKQPPGCVGSTASQEIQARDYVIDYLQVVNLEAPKPKMSSPNGVCGAIHYMDLAFNPERMFIDTKAPLGTLRVYAYAVTTVDWGNGEKDTYYSAGGPGINSDISHSWPVKDDYTITVSTTWHAQWSMGQYSGVLQATPVTRSIPFTVYELQAVLR